jgi:hypothetical protein
MLRDDASPLSDAAVDAFLNASPAIDLKRTEQVRRLFVQRLLAALHPVPVRHVEQPWSFGRWIEAIRLSVGLSRADVATAINDDAHLLERLEHSDVPPWQVRTSAVADLICLFRIHISAVEEMFLKSQAVVRGHQTAAAAARSSQIDPKSRGEAARKALDLYLAAKSHTSVTSSIPPGVMDALRRELEQRSAFDLLGAVK